VLTGLAIAFGELAVGLGVLLGLWTRLAAVGGLLLALSFFLTVSWSTRPYFYGSDIVFLFAWTPLVLAGDGGVLSVLNPIRSQVRHQLGVRPGRATRPEVAAEVERRTALRAGVLAGTLGVLAAVLGGASAYDAGRRRSSADATGPVLTETPTPAPTPSADSPTPTSGQGTALGPVSQVPVGGAASFTDPTDGQPAYVVQPTAGTFKAFSAVCTHAGCTVQFQQGTFVCPCHASTFDGRTGAVLTGPAPSGLPAIPLHVSGGTIYAA
jgi:thiosulfate dehydrogenase [quinone] large subunit